MSWHPVSSGTRLHILEARFKPHFRTICKKLFPKVSGRDASPQLLSVSAKKYRFLGEVYSIIDNDYHFGLPQQSFILGNTLICLCAKTSPAFLVDVEVPIILEMAHEDHRLVDPGWCPWISSFTTSYFFWFFFVVGHSSLAHLGEPLPRSTHRPLSSRHIRWRHGLEHQCLRRWYESIFDGIKDTSPQYVG